MPASWNQIVPWLRQIDGLRRARLNNRRGPTVKKREDELTVWFRTDQNSN